MVRKTKVLWRNIFKPVEFKFSPSTVSASYITQEKSLNYLESLYLSIERRLWTEWSSRSVLSLTSKVIDLKKISLANGVESNRFWYCVFYWYAVFKIKKSKFSQHPFKGEKSLLPFSFSWKVCNNGVLPAPSIWKMCEKCQSNSCFQYKDSWHLCAGYQNDQSFHFSSKDLGVL